MLMCATCVKLLRGRLSFGSPAYVHGRKAESEFSEMGRPRKHRLLGSRGPLPSHINDSAAAPRSESQRWYNLRRWYARRKHQLRVQPFCVYCAREGYTVAATVADHIIPHRGDPKKFWTGALQSMCAYHHNAYKKSEEIRGYSREIGLDGYPVDPRHPISRLRSKKEKITSVKESLGDAPADLLP